MTPTRVFERVFAAALGLLLGLAMLKFGNPVILDHKVSSPSGFWEFLLTPWPLAWGYSLLLLVLLTALPVLRFRTRAPAGLILLPCAWLLWEAMATTRTLDPSLSRITLLQFTACVLLFYVGLLALARLENPAPFWIPMIMGFSLVLWFGFDQHNGGLEATRQAFFSQPDWQQNPPELIRRLSSRRVFATLFYPNALASLILLVAAPLIFQLWQNTSRWPRTLRAVTSGLVAYFAGANFIWSGSKGAWLIALALLPLIAVRLPLRAAAKWSAVALLMLLGLVGFWFRHSDYLAKGATSATARLEYWQSALRTTAEHPVLGTGPGTFSITYARNKRPDAEMSRLTHNDYLQQASDSGIPGLLLYTAMFGGLLVWIHPRTRYGTALWLISLGLVAWSLHGLSEFGLYIPALSWTAFTLLGYACGRAAIGLDTSSTPG